MAALGGLLVGGGVGVAETPSHTKTSTKVVTTATVEMTTTTQVKTATVTHTETVAAQRTDCPGRVHNSGAGIGSISVQGTTCDESPNPPPTPSSGLLVGLNADSQGWGPQMGSRQDLAASAGAGWLREEFGWSIGEPADGQFVWDRFDQVLTNATQRRLHVLPLLLGTPAWAGVSWGTIPSDPSKFADYVAHVTARYGPGGTFWAAHPELDASFAPQYFEVWNEPYYPQFSAGNIDPARYARLFRAAAAAGRAANSAARFLVAAETDVQPTGTSQWVAWPKAMVAAVPDLGSYVDGIAVHPYSGRQSPDTPLDSFPHDKFLRMNLIRQYFKDVGIDKPYWITEVGWSTCTSNATYCVSEQTQASYITQMFALLRTQLTYVHAVFAYHLTDLGANPDPSDKEARYGLMRTDGSHKPAWQAFNTAATQT